MELSEEIEVMESNRMEIMIESDEEDASLIEEMERREKGNERIEQIKYQESVVKKKDGPKIIVKLKNGEADGEKDELCVPIYDVERNGETCMENEFALEEQLKDLGNDYEFMMCSRDSLDTSKSYFGNKEASLSEHDLTGAEYEMDGVQILKLDMSASELLLAKSAAALRARSSKKESYGNPLFSHNPHPNHCVDNGDQAFSLRNNYSSNERIPREKKQSAGNYSCIVQNKKSEVFSCESVDQKKWLLERKLGIVNFHCSFCDFRIPFTEEHFSKILDHIYPLGREFHILDSSDKIVYNGYKERVKMILMVAKVKDDAQVRFASYLTCTYCDKEFLLDLNNRGVLVIHRHICKSTITGGPFYHCFFCDREVHRNIIKKHFTPSSKSYCRPSENITLQLMSCTCQTYAEEHKPVCVVCNESSWSFIGQLSHQNPVCETCCHNICCGKTTKLYRRDLSKCALCSDKCSSIFVTYWASELESLFIGYNCIRDLKNPDANRVHDIIQKKSAKIRKTMETGLKTIDDGSLLRSEIAASTSKSSLLSLEFQHVSKLRDEIKFSNKSKKRANNQKKSKRKPVKKQLSITKNLVVPALPSVASSSFTTSTGSFRFLDKRFSPLCATSVHDLPGYSPSNTMAALSFMENIFPKPEEHCKSITASILPEPISQGSKSFIMMPVSENIKFLRILPESFSCQDKVKTGAEKQFSMNHSSLVGKNLGSRSKVVLSKSVKNKSSQIDISSQNHKFQDTQSSVKHSLKLPKIKCNSSFKWGTVESQEKPVKIILNTMSTTRAIHENLSVSEGSRHIVNKSGCSYISSSHASQINGISKPIGLESSHTADITVNVETQSARNRRKTPGKCKKEFKKRNTSRKSIK